MKIYNFSKSDRFIESTLYKIRIFEFNHFHYNFRFIVRIEISGMFEFLSSFKIQLVGTWWKIIILIYLILWFASRRCFGVNILDRCVERWLVMFDDFYVMSCQSVKYILCQFSLLKSFHNESRVAKISIKTCTYRINKQYKEWL